MPTRKATRRSTKEHNSRLVLKTFFENKEISRADVARVTGLTKATVSDLVSELIDQGLLAESRYAEVPVGKPPLLLEIERDGRHLICLDLANQEFRGAVVNLRGEFVYTFNIPRDGRVGQEAIEGIYQLIDSLLAKTQRPLLGIGIGTPGLINSTNGFIHSAVNMQWQNVPLGEMLAARYELPIHIANDSQIAALAEYLFGDCKLSSNLVAIKMGRGIGAGIVLNGQLYQGDAFGAGEIGHIRVAENTLLCRCGNTGCLETIATSRAILQRAQAQVADHPESSLHAIHPADMTFEHIQFAFQAGDSLTASIIQEAGKAVGIAVSNLIGILNIKHIVFSGDMTELGEPWLAIIWEKIKQSTLPALHNSTQLTLSCLNKNEVIQGASALVLTRELGIIPSTVLVEEMNGASL